VEALLAFVSAEQFPGLHVPYAEGTGRFDALDREVVALATAAGLNHLIPDAGLLARSLDRHNPQPVEFVGGTNLPADLHDGVYDVYPEQGWRQAMQRLREAARVKATEGDIQTPATEPVPTGKQGKQKKVTRDAEALGLFCEDQTRTITVIAELLGVPTQSLAPTRCPKLHAAMKAYKGSNANDRRKVRGSKDRDGNIEAYEDET
jgi:hypothetical protein